MGIEYDLTDLLIKLKSQGVRFDRVLTLGRQNYAASVKGTRALFAKYRVPCTWVPPDPYPMNYADGLFAALGSKEIESLDISAAERATILHDLNNPVPETLHNQFDIVLDGGTIEHVFNIPQALFNCMRMVRVGGKLIIETPANNFMGHGFYQFSPELFFSLLSSQNGYRVDSMTVVECSPWHRMVEAVAPNEARQRFETTTFWRTEIICVATKLADVAFSTPQQSDYANVGMQVGGHLAYQHHKITWIERCIVEKFPRLATLLKAIKFSAIRPSLTLRNRIAFRKR
jgi:SAM-dependent methyltransferase